MANLTAIIIGAGSIGAMKDDKYDSPSTETVLTVANAVYRNKQIDLIGVCDTHRLQAETAAFKWNTKAYHELESLPNADIIFVCSPTKTHLEVIRAVRDKAKLIVCEKPFCDNLEEAVEAAKLHQNIGVNYSRRYEASHHMIKQLLDEAECYSAILKYGRGLKRDACHGLELFNWWFGQCKSHYSSVVGWSDYDVNDLTRSFVFRFEKCDHVHFVPVPSSAYSIFEIELHTEKGRFIFHDNGIWLSSQMKEKENHYGDYMSLSPNTTLEATNVLNMLESMVQNAVLNVTKGIQMNCTSDDAIKVHEIIKYEMQAKNPLPVKMEAEVEAGN